MGVSIEPSLPSELSSQLKKKLLGDYAATGHLRKIQSLIHGGVDRAQTGDWKSAAERFRMAGRYTKLVWNCHLECMKRDSGGGNDGDLVRYLWLMSIDVIANHVQCLINTALDLGVDITALVVPTNSGDKARLQEARAVAEWGIRFLSARPTRSSDEIENEEDIRIRKAKAKLSFRTHLACKGLGDVDAAIGYLQEAKRYEPETAVKLDEKTKALRIEGDNTPGYEGTKPVILWDGRQMWCF